MKLSGLTLETHHFDDYLSFLTEVLELELQELTDISMRLELDGNWLEIKKVPKSPSQVATEVEFSLPPIEFHDLVQKINFYYYRRGPTRFLFMAADAERCQMIDPDGRSWTFRRLAPLFESQKPSDESVRNF